MQSKFLSFPSIPFNRKCSISRAKLFFLMVSLFLLSCTGCRASTVSNGQSVEPKPEVTEVVKKTPSPSPEVDRWTGIVGKKRIKITKSDIVIENQSGGKSLLMELVNDIRKEKVRSNPVIANCWTKFSFSVTSLVGRFLSLEQEIIEDCPDSETFGNSAGRRTLPITLDLNRNGPLTFEFNKGFLFYDNDRSAKLTDIFSQSELINAILTIKGISDQRPMVLRKTIHTVSDLVVALKGVDLGTNGRGDLTKESFRAFIFDRVESDSVYVRLSLEPAGSRRNAEYVEIKLQLPQTIGEQLIQANNGTGGFLGNVAGLKVPFEIEL